MAAIALAPWFTYNYIYLGRVTLSPAGGVGRGLWEGAWQGHWPGRVQAALTTLAEESSDRVELERRVRSVAAENGLAAAPMLRYVNEWRDIRAIWDTPTDPMERADARVRADDVYLSHAIAVMRDDPIGHVRRRLTRGLFLLWAAEVPIRYGQINATPTIVDSRDLAGSSGAAAGGRVGRGRPDPRRPMARSRHAVAADRLRDGCALAVVV